ncbi:MAG: DUF302 domain-containing protein [Syntrophobacteraceae bacterium]
MAIKSMSMVMKRSRAFLLAALLSGAMVAAPAFAQSAGNGFVMVKSAHGYAATLNSLQRAIKSNGLMVMGKVNQKAILSMTGLNLEGGESFLVGNPRMGKKLFSMNPAVAAVIPSRISVWAEHGTTYVGYFNPSALLGQISPQLAKPGAMLDMKFHKIVSEATK